MAIFDDPNWLKDALPHIAMAMQQPDIQTTAPVRMGGGMSGPMPTSAPEFRKKRTLGNVLHDIFTDHLDAQGVPVSEKISALGNAFTNAARNWRGQDAVDTVSPVRDARQKQMEWDQKQNELAKIAQAQHLYGNLLTNPLPVDEEQLAQIAPQLLADYRGKQQEQEAAQAETAVKAEERQFNHGKPVPLGGNGGYMLYAPDDPAANSAGWVIHEGQPPMQKFETGDGQGGLIDTRTGTFKPVGGRKIPVRKTAVVEVQGPNGPIKQLVDSDTGLPIRTIGASPITGKEAEKAGASDVSKILADNNITLTGPDPVAELIRGSTSGTLQNIASKIPAMFGDTTAGQKNIGKLATIDNAIVLALAGGKLGAGVSNADRDFFKEMAGQISDPNVPADKRLAAWAQVRTRLRSIVEREKSGAPAPAATNPALEAELRKRGLVK